MYEGGINIETYSAGAGRDGGQRAAEVHCYATPIYNLGKCRLTDEFFRAFATLILWNSHLRISMSTREDLSIDISITNVEQILTKLWWFIFSGYRQTDTVLESSYGNMSAHNKFQLKAQNYWLAADPYMPPRRTGMHEKYFFTTNKVCNLA